LIQQRVETVAARLLIGGQLKEGGTLKVDVKKGELKVEAAG
jgi:ATP-dependent Clp protease ATP-binding subunit ClpA